jgi:hypothetical protein
VNPAKLRPSVIDKDVANHINRIKLPYWCSARTIYQMDAGGNFFLYNTNFPLGARRLASGVRMRTLSSAARAESHLPILPHHRYSAMFLVSPSHLPEATLGLKFFGEVYMYTWGILAERTQQRSVRHIDFGQYL